MRGSDNCNEWILRMTGRLVTALIGLVVMIVGLVLTQTIVAALIGLPMSFSGWY